MYLARTQAGCRTVECGRQCSRQTLACFHIYLTGHIVRLQRRCLQEALTAAEELEAAQAEYLMRVHSSKSVMPGAAVPDGVVANGERGSGLARASSMAEGSWSAPHAPPACLRDCVCVGRAA